MNLLDLLSKIFKKDSKPRMIISTGGGGGGGGGQRGGAGGAGGSVHMAQQKSNYLIKLLFIVIVLIVAYFLFFNKSTWMPIYYPNANSLFNSIFGPKLDSLEECRAWIKNLSGIFNPSGKDYDYECGKNCKFDKSLELYVCKETIK